MDLQDVTVMISLPTPPRPGEPIRSSLIRDLIRAIRERTIIQGPGVKTSTGPNGTTISAAPGNKGSSYTPTPQCFDLVTETVDNGGDGEDEEEPETVYKLTRCYYSAGDQLRYVEDIELEEEFGYGILCFRIDLVATDSAPQWADTPWVSHFDNLANLQAAQENSAYVLIPLYKFEASSSYGTENPPFVKLVDLRSALRSQLFESLQEEED